MFFIRAWNLALVGLRQLQTFDIINCQMPTQEVTSNETKATTTTNAILMSSFVHGRNADRIFVVIFVPLIRLSNRNRKIEFQIEQFTVTMIKCIDSGANNAETMEQFQ